MSDRIISTAGVALLALLGACETERSLPTEPTPISQLSPTYPLPVSCFETRPAPPEVPVGETIVLDANCAVAGSEPIIEYDWHLGDGRRLFGPVIEVRYEVPGRYEIQLRVRDESGQQDTSSGRVVVR